MSDELKLLLEFLAGRRSSVSFINKLIDTYFEDKKEIDLALHFLNEAVLHRSPELFLHNYIKYEIAPGVLRGVRKASRRK